MRSFPARRKRFVLVGMLIVAGVLALTGRSDYRLWRQWQKAEKDREAAERRARRRFEK